MNVTMKVQTAPTSQIAEKRVVLRNILYATDFSAAAENALKYAGALAKIFAAKLYAFHVQEPENYALPPELWHSAEQVRQEQLQQLRNNVIRAFPGVSSEVIVGQGGLWPAMALTVEKYQIDLIV